MARTATGAISLTAGYHTIAAAYYQGTGGYGMDMQISGAGNTTYTDINTTNATITPDLVVGSLSGSGNISLSTGSLIIGTDNTNKSYSGVISSAVGVPAGVSKWGTGTQTLSGVNTFTGGMMINAGTLAVANDSALGTGTLNHQ